MGLKKPRIRFQQTCNVMGLFLILLGCAVMLGWLFKISTLVQVLPGIAPMQFNAALCFLFSGLIVFFYQNTNRYIINTIAWVILMIAGLTLVQYVFTVNIGIDEFFVSPFVSNNISNPGRMAPNTALCFILFSLFVFFSNIENKFFLLLAIFLPCIFGVLGLVSLVGYAFGVEQAYGWGNVTQMALRTAIAFIILAVSCILLLASKKALSKQQVSNMFDYAVFTVSLLFSVILWQVVGLNYMRILKDEASDQVALVNAKIAVEVKSDIEALVRLFSRFSTQSYANLSGFNRDLDYYFKHMSALESIYFYSEARGMTIRFNPYLNNHSKNGHCNLLMQANLSEKSKQLRFSVNEHAGHLCITTRDCAASINLKTIVSRFVEKNSSNFVISVRYKGNTLLQNGFEDAEYQKLWANPKNLELYGTLWTVAVYPSSLYVQQTIGRIPLLIFCLGVLISSLILFLLRYRRKLIAKENELLSSEAIKATILNSTLEGILGVNQDFKIYFMNQSAQKLLHFNFENEYMELDKLFTQSHKSNLNHLIQSVKDSLYNGVSSNDNADIFLKANLTPLPIIYSSSPIIQNNEITGAIVIFFDSTKRSDFEKNLKKLAWHDSLTGLPNRASINAHLKEVIARAKRHDYHFSLCFIDINHFKSINDNYGHHVGDLTLQYVATLISNMMRENDFFGRLAGDEFCLILDGIYLKKDIDPVLAKINKSFESPFIVDNHSLTISLSIGVISYTDESTPEALLIKADTAMYQVKKHKK